MPSHASIVKIQTMYVAYYGRPGDPDGVDYWASRLDDNGGNLHAVIDAFGNSQEYIDDYGGLETGALVSTLFRQILGRAADPEGLRFYTELLDSGTKTPASIALDIANGVQGDDIATLSNKIEVAQHFTAAIAASGAPYGDVQLVFAKTIMAGVSSDANTVDAANAASDAYVQAVGEDAVSGYFQTTAPLGPDSPVVSRIDFPGDNDVFYIELEAGVEYRFDLAGTDGNADPFLGVYDENYAYQAGYDSLILFTPATTGTYYLDVGSSFDDETGTGIYSLSVDWLGHDPIAGDISSNRVLLPGASEFGYIDYVGDEDWFYIELTAGTEYQFDLKGVEAGAVLNPVLGLYDASGAFLLENDDGGRGPDSQLLYTPTVSGGYFLAAAGFGGATGAYGVAAKEAFAATPLTITFDDPTGELASYRDIIKNNILAAWQSWDVYIDAAAGAALEIVVTPFEDEALASAGPRASTFLYDNVYRGTAAHELITGDDQNGLNVDGVININADHLREVGYYDFILDDYTPPSQTSFKSLMEHELGHILGFIRDYDSPAYASPYETLVNRFTSEFTGAYAVAANGGPVALAEDEDYIHLADPDALMSPVAYRGDPEEISAIEIAILADLGLPIYEQYLFA